MSGIAPLLRADLRHVSRDPMLILLASTPLLVLALFYATRVALTARLSDASGAALQVSALPVLLILTPLMFGFVYGLMLLDQRDEGVLAAAAVTPFGKDGLLAYRMVLPALWSALAAMPMLLLLRPADMGLARMLVLSLLCALQAPMLPLFLGAFAANKLEGLGLAKVGSILISAGAAAVLLPMPWEIAAMVSPHYWLVRLTLPAPGGALYGTIAPSAAVATHLLTLYALRNRFTRRAG